MDNTLKIPAIGAFIGEDIADMRNRRMTGSAVKTTGIIKVCLWMHLLALRLSACVLCLSHTLIIAKENLIGAVIIKEKHDT